MHALSRAIALGAAAVAIGASPAWGQEEPPGPPSPCPDAFVPAPSVVVQDADRNDDAWICIKFEPGESDQVVIIDNPRPFPPL